MRSEPEILDDIAWKRRRLQDSQESAEILRLEKQIEFFQWELSQVRALKAPAP